MDAERQLEAKNESAPQSGGDSAPLVSMKDMQDFHSANGPKSNGEHGLKDGALDFGSGQSGVLGLYLEPGQTYDYNKGNITLRPMNPEERAADEKRRAYLNSPEYQRDMERARRQIR